MCPDHRKRNVSVCQGHPSALRRKNQPLDSGFDCHEADRRSRTETAGKNLLLNKRCQCPFKQTALQVLFSLSKRFMWVPAMQWFHPAVFHNYSVFTHPFICHWTRGITCFIWPDPICAPQLGWQLLPTCSAWVGKSLSCVFIPLRISSHHPHCTSAHTAYCTGATRVNGHRICSLRRAVCPLFI